MIAATVATDSAESGRNEARVEVVAVNRRRCFSMHLIRGNLIVMGHSGIAGREYQDILDALDARRRGIASQLEPGRQRRFGQFFTPLPVAEYMASLIDVEGATIRILEPGAGMGSLVAPVVADLCTRRTPPERIEITAIEIDTDIAGELHRTLRDCKRHCRLHGVELIADVVRGDFVEFAVNRLADQLSFDSSAPVEYDIVIQNPPYRKIRSNSWERRLLERVGIETSNLYAAFLALGARLLKERGQLVAITPRSFCNGPYFKRFRRQFLELMTFTRIHVIESRNEAFAEDGVLQENVIFKSVRGVSANSVNVTSGSGSAEAERFGRRLAYCELVRPDDPDLFIHLVPEPDGSSVADAIRNLPCRLENLDLSVSTGRVVDFRARDHLRWKPGSDTAPLIYPAHFRSGYIDWPIAGRKPNAIAVAPETRKLLVPEGVYVLVKRFSAKEEAKRIVAAVIDPECTPAPSGVGFENHINYFHSSGRGITHSIALGLAAYLNSTAVDMFFRQFSGHTQVNASDLRKLRYPTRDALDAVGSQIGAEFPDQEHVDRLIDPILRQA